MRGIQIDLGVCEDYLRLDLPGYGVARCSRRTADRQSCGRSAETGLVTIMIVPLEDALLLVYRTRRWGEAWQDQNR
jgi:hypothetical protein